MAKLHIEVAYVLAKIQDLVRLEMAEGATADEAVRASGMTERHPELAAADWLLGIFGKRVPAETLLRDGDRVDILRPLPSDPKEERRRRARAARRRR